MKAKLDAILDSSPAWLISVGVHLLLFIILAIIMLPMALRPRIEAEIRYTEEIGKDHTLETLAGSHLEGESTAQTLELIKKTENPMPVLPSTLLFSNDGNVAFSTHERLPMQLMLSGRDDGQKEGLLKRGGGNAATQEAVERALSWLARNQLSDGSWSLQGPYTNGVGDKTQENRVAATAMALIAFQGNGVTPFRGIQSKNVEKAWKWLLKQQQPNGCFFKEGPYQHRFYTQGMCTIAICELYGMTRNDDYRFPAQRALKYCLERQSKEGGWRYLENADADISVTGWIVMAMQSAKMAGLNVPPEHFARVSSFLDSLEQKWGSRYPYHKTEDGGIDKDSMTAEALLCRMYLGWAKNDPRIVRGMQTITEPNDLVRFDVFGSRDVYFWYYVTQAAHHIGEPFWKTWNEAMRQNVCEAQIKDGAEAGSWHPEQPVRDAWAEQGGRLYVTCFLTYMLEVYYRHLPLYKNTVTGYE